MASSRPSFFPLKLSLFTSIERRLFSSITATGTFHAMSVPSILESGELSVALKREMSRQFGVLVETQDDQNGSADLDNGSNSVFRMKTASRQACGDTLKYRSARTKVAPVVLEGLHTAITSVGVPYIGIGSRYATDTNSGIAHNQDVIYTMQAPLRCIEQTEEDKVFVSEALDALDGGVRAVLISSKVPHSSLQNQTCHRVEDATLIRSLVDKNFQLEFRDDKSRLERADAELKAQIENGSGVCLGCDGEKPNERPFVVDPFNGTSPRQIWVKVSLDDWTDSCNLEMSPDEVQDQAWRWWTTMQVQVGTNPKLCLCLELGSSVPKDGRILRRWLAERLRAIVLPAGVWRFNKGGWPILTAALKSFIIDSFHTPHVTYLITAGMDDFPTIAQDGFKKRKEMENKFIYLLHLYKEYYASVRDPYRRWKLRHLADIPIRPLQPLRDHLTQEVYSVFEEDVVKYQMYNKACYAALKDLQKSGRGMTEDDPIIAMVVGAGRGPLVTQFLHAVDTLEMFFKIYALDKNPIAIAAMFAKVDDEWALHANSIQIVESDMRSFDPEEKADILISELLGSFGCNELSPECLDGAQRFLKASGISIPCSYKNFLQPIMAVTTYEDLETYAPKAENLLNEMVLVELRSCVAIAPYQEVFTFTHPNFASHCNAREVTLTFRSDLAYRMTGFAGYFELCLYKDISISILPDRHTIGLTSWFPAFFGLHRPVSVKSGDTIKLNIARRVNEQQGKVWYVWHLEEPETLPVQNAPPDHWIAM